jgi:tetratricopeptide (TPR) repeat protein
VELKLGDIDRAIAAYEAGLRLNPLDVATTVWLGVVEAGQGAAESAIERFRLAEQLAPDISPTYLTYLAYGYGLAGAADDAMRLFRRIEAASQEYSIGPGNLAMAHLAIGDEQRALMLLGEQVDNPGPAEGVMSLWTLWLNEVADQRLEQPEFREMRSRYRFRE